MSYILQGKKLVDRNLLVALTVQFIETSLAVRYDMSCIFLSSVHPSSVANVH